MGRNYIRQIHRTEDRWNDSDAKKHTHDFSVPAIAVLNSPPNCESRFLVLKCKYCNSFRSIPQKGAPNGLITEEIAVGNLHYRKMYFKTEHKNAVSFHDMVFVREEA